MGMAKTLVTKAKNGNVLATRQVLDRCVGKAVVTISQESAQEHEVVFKLAGSDEEHTLPPLAPPKRVEAKVPMPNELADDGASAIASPPLPGTSAWT